MQRAALALGAFSFGVQSGLGVERQTSSVTPDLMRLSSNIFPLEYPVCPPSRLRLEPECGFTIRGQSKHEAISQA